MENNHDEKHRELVVHRERQPNEDAVQQNAELQNGNADDLRRRRVADRRREVVLLAARLEVRVGVREARLVAPAAVAVRVDAVRVAALLELRRGAEGRLRRAIDLRAVRRVRGEPVPVRVVRKAEACEARGAYAESDELDDEDGEDAEEADPERVRL